MEILCSICTEPLFSDKVIVTTSCHHVFHEGCIEDWLKRWGNESGDFARSIFLMFFPPQIQYLSWMSHRNPDERLSPSLLQYGAIGPHSHEVHETNSQNARRKGTNAPGVWATSAGWNGDSIVSYSNLLRVECTFDVFTISVRWMRSLKGTRESHQRKAIQRSQLTTQENRRQRWYQSSLLWNLSAQQEPHQHCLEHLHFWILLRILLAQHCLSSHKLHCKQDRRSR